VTIGCFLCGVRHFMVIVLVLGVIVIDDTYVSRR